MANSSALRKFTNQVKKMRKAHPSMSFRAAQRKVKANNNRRPVAKKKKRAPVKARKKAKRVGALRTISKTHTDKNRFKNVDIQIGSVAGHMSAARRVLEQRLGHLEVLKFKAKKKSVRNGYAKKITAVKAQIRKLC